MDNVAQADASDDTIERASELAQFEEWIERPMQVLGFVWLGLLILDFTRGLSPLLAGISTAIWVMFAIDFALRMILAPAKIEYLKHNWLIAISLVVPALRVFSIFRALRVLRAARVLRGFRLVRVVSSLNRGMGALSRSMGRRGLGYVLALSTLVTFGGAAGMYAFERGIPGAAGLGNYGSALWWTAMIMTTLGSSYWPQSAEGRLLCLLLAVYAFAVWGYVTASLATYFVGRDADDDEAEIPGRKEIELLRSEIAGLRADIREARQKGG
jgi:voltage-gated potassium channel